MRTITLNHTESIPIILSLLTAGREDIVVPMLERMAKKADAFGQDVEIIVSKDELLVLALGETTSTVIETYDHPSQELIQDLVNRYPSSAVVYL